MKAFLFSLLILIIPISSAFAQTFRLHENGVTVVCDGAQPGDTGTIFGETYTAVNEATLRSMVNNNENVETVCISLVTNMNRLFQGKSSYNGDISSWDVAKVTNMESMFNGASNFNGDISSWDVSNVTTMSYMFERASDFNGDLSQWNVAKVTDMGSMFYSASNFNSDISQWDVANVTDMGSVFRKASAFNSDISQWDVAKVMDMGRLFQSATAFNSDISQWDVSNVTIMLSMFSSASNFNRDLSNWCVDKISAAPADFSSGSALTTERSPLWGTCPGKPTAIQLHENGVTVVCDGAQAGDTGSIFGTTYTAVSEATLRSMVSNNENVETVCTSLVTDMNRLFRSKSSFNGDISSWDVAKVTNMEFMFDRATNFNGDISQWDVAKVTNMDAMFFGPSNFNGDISQWDVANVTTMQFMFRSATAFNSDISQWDVAKVTNMRLMFWGASNFNGDISQWDVSKVTNMDAMFFGASNFNGDISQWDVANVTNMDAMFSSASNFNGDLSNWCVDKISAAPTNFSANSALTTEKKPLWGTCPGTPAAIQLSVPANGAFNQPTTPTFQWAVDTSAASYQIQVFEGFSITVLDSTVQTNGLSLQKDLNDNAQHSWRVRGISGNKIGDWSSVWNFTTGVITSISEDLPTETSLQQNYPNPFNPSTQIRFSLAVSSAVVLDVYSIDGTKVASLVNQVLNAGWHTATFNAANLPTGLYLYRLNTGNQQITKKMMLMK